MKNREVAELLERLSLLSEASGDDRFKVIAYRRASTSVRDLPEDIETVWKRGALEDIQYVGEGIAKKIDEYLRTGKMSAVDRMEARVPPGAVELMQVPGVGPRTAYKLAKEHGVSSLAQLKEGLRSGTLTGVVGEVMARKLLESVEKVGAGQHRMLLAEALYLARDLVAYFDANGVDVQPAGSLRRGSSTVGDIDLLTKDRLATEVFLKYPEVDRVIEKGDTRTSVFLKRGTQVDLRVVAAKEYGAALMYFTGSKEHNVALRTLAIEKGWKLSEYGLFEGKTLIAGRTEEEVYSRLGMDYIAPELREMRGEMDAARRHRLPRLVEADELKGDLQMHSVWSDGTQEIEHMALAARDRGYQYIAVTDHSITNRIANGLTQERFEKQWKEIDELNAKLKPFRILKGVEAEIRSDGGLDYEREFLDRFDVVGVSLHFGYSHPAGKLTARVLRALAHPSVDFLCHPTNRLIGRREGHALDLPAVIRAAKDNGKMLEIDGSPKRMDLDEIWAKRAMEEGVPLLVDSDAHSTGELENVDYGIAIARRAWLQARHVANTLPLSGLMKRLA